MKKEEASDPTITNPRDHLLYYHGRDGNASSSSTMTVAVKAAAEQARRDRHNAVS